MENIAPNDITYSSAISACGDGGRWEHAVSLLREMQAKALVDPTVICYNSAITACGKSGAWRNAVAILRELHSAGVSATPNTRSYNAAILSLRCSPNSCVSDDSDR